MKTYKPNAKHLRTYTDQEYIDGLKGANAAVTHSFFYLLCDYTISDIRYSLFKNKIDHDELINELYIYLAEKNWSKLDTFKGLNKCKLKSWMVTLAWRFFIQNYERLTNNLKGLEEAKPTGSTSQTLETEMTIDVELALSRMRNERYVQVIRWMVVEDQTPQAVAKLLNTSVQNVYNIKHRALECFFKAFE